MKRITTSISSRNIDQAVIPLFLATFTFLLLFALRASEQISDGLAYASSVKMGAAFHPHHLSFLPIIHLFARGFCSAGVSCDVIFVAQIHNIMWSVVSVVAFYFLARKLVASNPVGLLAALCLLCSQGFWILSSQVEPYIPTFGCVMLLTAILMLRGDADLHVAGILGVSLLLAMAVLYHQASVLFCIPMGYYLLATQSRQRWRTPLAVFSLGGMMVLSAYVLTFLLTRDARTPGDFLRWLTMYVHHPNPDWGTFAHFSVTGLYQLFVSQSWAIVNASGIQITYDFASVMLVLLFLAFFTWNILQVARRAAHAKIRCFSLIWLVTYYVYFLWWLPSEWKFFILTLIPIILLALITLKDAADAICQSEWARRILMLVIATLAIIVLLAANTQVVLPLHQSRGQSYDEASALATIASPGCFFCVGYSVQGNLLYYFGVDRSYEIILGLLAFYQGESFDALPQLEREQCIIVPLFYVVPSFDAVGFNGYSQPSEWLGFTEWLFGFRYGSPGNLVACREFQVITEEKTGQTYVLMSSSPAEVDGLGELFEMLDSKISQSSGQQTDEFQRWLSTAYESHQ